MSPAPLLILLLLRNYSIARARDAEGAARRTWLIHARADHNRLQSALRP